MVVRRVFTCSILSSVTALALTRAVKASFANSRYSLPILPFTLSNISSTNLLTSSREISLEDGRGEDASEGGIGDVDGV